MYRKWKLSKLGYYYPNKDEYIGFKFVEDTIINVNKSEFATNIFKNNEVIGYIFQYYIYSKLVAEIYFTNESRKKYTLCSINDFFNLSKVIIPFIEEKYNIKIKNKILNIAKVNKYDKCENK